MTQRAQRSRAGRRGRAALGVVLGACLVGAAVAVFLTLSRHGASGGGTADAATTTATSSPAGTTAATQSSATSPSEAALPTGRLVTQQDLAGIGLTVGAPVVAEAPAFPALCGHGSWAAEWSTPAQSVGQDYPATGAAISEHAVTYATAAAASAALDQLVSDAAHCPNPADGGSIEHLGSAQGLPGSALFLRSDAGRDGATALSWIVVAPQGSALVETAYTTEASIGTGSGPADGGDDANGPGPQAQATATSLARLAADRFGQG